MSHFETAVSLDPGNSNARLFLANAYIRQNGTLGKQGNDTEVALLDAKAREQYRETVRRDPKNVAGDLRTVVAAGHGSCARSRASGC